MSACLIDECLAVLLILTDRNEAQPFLKPVDHVALKIPHYPQVVREPMDFETIKRKLADSAPDREVEGGQRTGYLYLDEFEADVHLIFSNSSLFNSEPHPVTQMGRIVEAVFNSQIKKLKRTLGKSESQRSGLSQSGTSSVQSIASSTGPSSRKRQRASSNQQREPSGSPKTSLTIELPRPAVPKRTTMTPLSAVMSQEKRRRSSQSPFTESPATEIRAKSPEAEGEDRKLGSAAVPDAMRCDSEDGPPKVTKAADDDVLGGKNGASRTPQEAIPRVEAGGAPSATDQEKSKAIEERREDMPLTVRSCFAFSRSVSYVLFIACPNNCFLCKRS